MKLQFTQKKSYGRTHKYLVDQDLAAFLEAVSKKKTITDEDIIRLQEKGIQCEEVNSI